MKLKKYCLHNKCKDVFFPHMSKSVVDWCVLAPTLMMASVLITIKTTSSSIDSSMCNCQKSQKSYPASDKKESM